MNPRWPSYGFGVTFLTAWRRSANLQAPPGRSNIPTPGVYGVPSSLAQSFGGATLIGEAWEKLTHPLPLSTRPQ
jgi:hypothetical protein